MEIYLVRHGIAVGREEDMPDALRPLTEKGRRRFRKTARAFARLGRKVNLILTSPLVRAVHIEELRAAIDSVRVAHRLEPFTWTDPTLVPGSTRVRAVHLTELRAALSQAYQAAGPTYTDPTVVPGVTVIKASHLNELRAAVRGLE